MLNGSRMTGWESKMTPKLRFPEFKDQWPITKLNQHTRVYDGTHQTPNYVPEGIPFYSVEHVTANNFISTRYISEKAFEAEARRVQIENGDILMTRIGDVGTSVLVDWKVRASFYVSLALIKRSLNFNSAYINQYIKTSKFQRELWKRTLHVAFPIKINLGEIGESEISMPTLKEQQKIADFLTEVDQKVAALEKRLRLLKQYKQGVMQKIFSQRVRFTKDDGNIFKDWSSQQMSTAYDFVGTNSLSRDALTDSGKIKNIHYGDIHTKFTKRLSLNNKNIPFIADLSHEANEASLLKEGDLLIADASEDYADVGKTIEIIETNKLKAVGGLHTILARPRPGLMSIGFGSYLMESILVRKQLMRIATGVSVLGISRGNLSKIALSIPELEEQQKIANFLTTIDNKITATQNQLTQTKQFKKALLQRMFV